MKLPRGCGMTLGATIGATIGAVFGDAIGVGFALGAFFGLLFEAFPTKSDEADESNVPSPQDSPMR